MVLLFVQPRLNKKEKRLSNCLNTVYTVLRSPDILLLVYFVLCKQRLRHTGILQLLYVPVIDRISPNTLSTAHAHVLITSGEVVEILKVPTVQERNINQSTILQDRTNMTYRVAVYSILICLAICFVGSRGQSG